uniref:Uncharacterized protein n=1 Tax=Vespula pensylvanica TaxID=30213 RepID=A0A834UBV6_VESPE|nr:hypothetical protein H0235_006074 [Vespula pensylvanica]
MFTRQETRDSNGGRTPTTVLLNGTKGSKATDFQKRVLVIKLGLNPRDWLELSYGGGRERVSVRPDAGLAKSRIGGETW